jgi:hypothetical protein
MPHIELLNISIDHLGWQQKWFGKLWCVAETAEKVYAAIDDHTR